MTKNTVDNRRQRYFQLNSHLAQIDNNEMCQLFDKSDSRAGWGKSHTLDIGEHKVFVKRIPITEVEYNNMFSTKNHYELPTYYNYGVGSAGFNIFRELVAHVKTTNWVLSGEVESFPLLYHYRVMPYDSENSGERIEVKPEQLERYVTYWGGNQQIGQYRLDKLDAKYELALFLEHIPHVLEFWLMEHSDQIDQVLEQLRLSVDFLRKHKIIHFDANFDNILTDGERVYLTDFGLVLDEAFDFSDEERAFFDAHPDYDFGCILSNLIYPIYELFKELPEDEQRQLSEKYGVLEGDDLFHKLLVLFEHLEELRQDDVIQVDQAYINCLLRYRDICLLMNNFYLDLRQNNHKDTKFPKAELGGLLREVGFVREVVS
ncbi:MAG: hypothetical protein AAF702_00825 [Chloroflexota bacterium]